MTFCAKKTLLSSRFTLVKLLMNFNCIKLKSTTTIAEQGVQFDRQHYEVTIKQLEQKIKDSYDQREHEKSLFQQEIERWKTRTVIHMVIKHKRLISVGFTQPRDIEYEATFPGRAAERPSYARFDAGGEKNDDRKLAKGTVFDLLMWPTRRRRRMHSR
jgi:hypothetical protein